MPIFGTVSSTNQLNFKNLIITGDMSVWQKGTSGSINSGGNAGRIKDLFVVEPRNGTTVNWARSTDVPSGENFAYSMRMYATNATDDGFHWRIPIELPGTGIYTRYGAGKTYTLSYWAKSAYSGRPITIVAGLTDSSSGSYLSTTQSLGAISLTTSWVRYTHTITFSSWVADGASNLANATSLVFRFLQGSNDTPDDTYITGIQFEEGSVATPFEFRPPQVELALCQRYYIEVGVRNASGTDVFPVSRWGTNLLATSFNTPVTMRATPTGSLTSTYRASGNGTNPSLTAISSVTTVTNTGVAVVYSSSVDPSDSQTYTALGASSTSKTALNAEL